MKKCLKTNIAGVSLIAVMTMVSCNKDEITSDLGNEEVITATELKASDEGELISEDIIGIAEDVYAEDEISATGKSGFRSDYLPECVTISTVVTDTTIERTIDFGSGCELPNGNYLAGTIYLDYAKDMEMATKAIGLSLDNFSFNGVAVTGSASVVRQRSNGNGNPQSDASWTFEGLWPNDDNFSFNGNRTREWIEGYASGFWADNVFLITGKGTFKSRSGNIFVKEIQEPLRREWSCRFVVSGTMLISRNDASVSLDFGDGSCDGKGLLTYADGSTKEIFLRRFLND
jgi:hypothetical protein